MSSVIDLLPSGKHFNKVIALIAVFLFIFFNLLFNRHSLDDAYINFKINSRVEVIGYDHSYPFVTSKSGASQRPFTLYAPLKCRDYIMTGDSILKLKVANEMQVIRDSSDYFIITNWVDYREHYAPPLLGRRVVKR